MLAVILLGLLPVAVGAALFLPQMLESWLHRHRASRLARWAFVPLGVRRLSPGAEGVRRIADGYRTASRVEVTPRFPSGKWSLGKLEAEVAPDGTYAVLRVDEPYTRFPVGHRPVNVVTTMRITPGRDAEGLVLRAHVLPNWLGTWLCVPLLALWLYPLHEDRGCAGARPRSDRRCS